MASIQRRCPKCARAVPRGTKACGQCGGKDFTYRVRYTGPDGAQRSKSFARKADAENFEASVSHHIRAGLYVDPGAGQETIESYLEEWRLRQTHHRPRMVATTATRFKTMVYPHLGHTPIGRLRPSMIEEWQRTLLTVPYSPSTIKGCRGQMAGAFNAAVRDRRITASPFEGVKAPEVVATRVIPKTTGQVKTLTDAMLARYRAVVILVAGSGLRYAEAMGLTVDRVDWERRTVTVDRQLAGRAGNQPLFGPPKTPKSNRTVPVGPTVLGALKQHVERFGSGVDGLIFITGRGGPLTRTTFSKQWRPAARAAGFAEDEGLHQLRHYYASLLIAAGRSVKEVQERLGHASAMETLDTYAHLWGDSDEGTRDAVEAAFLGHGLAITPPGNP